MTRPARSLAIFSPQSAAGLLGLLTGPQLLAAAPPGSGESGGSFLDVIADGGIVGYVILGLSLLAVALIVKHLIQIRLEALSPQYAVDALADMLGKGKVDEAIAYCNNPDNSCLLTSVIGSGLGRYRRSPFGALELKPALEEAGQEQVARLARSTDGLALVASIAPMLGLLGTVVGINGAFGTIASADGFSRPDQLAGDISLALITTIMGLTLAIPATSAVTYFRNRIERLAADIAVTIDDLASVLEKGPSARSTAPRPTAPQAGA